MVLMSENRFCCDICICLISETFVIWYDVFIVFETSVSSVIRYAL